MNSKTTRSELKSMVLAFLTLTEILRSQAAKLMNFTRRYRSRKSRSRSLQASMNSSRKTTLLCSSQSFRRERPSMLSEKVRLEVTQTQCLTRSKQSTASPFMIKLKIRSVLTSSSPRLHDLKDSIKTLSEGTENLEMRLFNSSPT